MNIDYNKLKFFLEVVHSKSITAAAKKLHRTQSALSQALSSLEKQLGTKLILWEGKRMTLTHQGKLLYKAAGDRIEAIDEAVISIRNRNSEVSGSIAVGVLRDHSTTMQRLLFQAITRFRIKYPSVTFNIQFGTSREIEQGLLDRNLDIGLLINFQEEDRFTLLEIATEEHLIVTSPFYLNQKGPLNSIEQIVAGNLLDIDTLFTCFTPWVRYHDQTLLQTLQKKEPVITAADFLMVKDFLLAGLGIAVLPRYLIEKELESGTAIQLLPTLKTLRVWVNCASELGKETPLSEQLFLEELKNL
jgi:DNA-binding transcriptional LysR family regulator